ncbi:MAG: amidohydrolase [Chloroflexi bacterium]|nr:amidohydrolase [Chloroflexota bacterium]
MIGFPTILFRGAHLLGRWGDQAVLVRDGVVAWVGRDADLPTAKADRTVDCGGATLLPGLHDAHIHLLAYAASLRDAACGPSSAKTIGDIGRLIAERSARTPPGRWVRGRGYDEFSLAEGRRPDRRDLDAAAPGHPVRLDHRSGHATVLNSLALARVGIGPDTPDPVEGVIERDAFGEPTGVLYEMGGWVSQRAGDDHTPQEQRDAIAEASANLLGWGITSITDATPENDPARREALRQYQAEGLLKQRVTFMPGIHHLEAFAAQGMTCGSGDATLRLGHAKVMATLTTGGLHPSEPELRDLVAAAHRLGFPVAVHAVEEEAILAVLAVVQEGQTQDLSPGFGDLRSRFGLSDRLEHCSEATSAVLSALKAAGVAVCANPTFLYESGARYRATVPPETLPWLYPLRSLLDAGVPLLAGSDAPVASPNPWQGMYAALTRRDAGGQALHPEQGVSLEQALGMYADMRTYGHTGIRAGDMAGIPAGDVADLALLDRDVAQAEAEALLSVRARVVLVGGEVAWEG